MFQNSQILVGIYLQFRCFFPYWPETCINFDTSYNFNGSMSNWCCWICSRRDMQKLIEKSVSGSSIFKSDIIQCGKAAVSSLLEMMNRVKTSALENA